MKYERLKYLIKTDLYRYQHKCDFRTFFKELLLNYSFKQGFLLRVCRYYYLNNNKLMLFIFKVLLRHFQTKYGTLLSYKTEIGTGLYLGHLRGIGVSTDAVIGNNANFSHYVSIGSAERGAYKGVSEIGDNVYFAPGSQIFGKIKIGNNVLIGANSVVTRDVPDNAVVIGNPAKIVSSNGSFGYVNNTDYEKLED